MVDSVKRGAKSVHMLKSMPTLIFVKTVFDVEKCLAKVRVGVLQVFFLIEAVLAARCYKL